MTNSKNRHAAFVHLLEACGLLEDAESLVDKAIDLLGPYDHDANTGHQQNGVSIEDVCLDAAGNREDLRTLISHMSETEKQFRAFQHPAERCHVKPCGRDAFHYPSPDSPGTCFTHYARQSTGAPA